MLDKIKILLEEAKTRESFFMRIASFLPQMDPRYQTIERAYNAAKDAFRDVQRDNGDRYFEHLRGTSLIQIAYLRVKNFHLIASCLLHDTVEDIPSWTIERIRMAFGDEIALNVDWVTKPRLENFSSEKERDKAYYARFPLAPRDFWLIKLPDRLHNLMTLWPYSQEKIARKIEETKIYYLPYAEQHLILLHELEEALENLERNNQKP